MASAYIDKAKGHIAIVLVNTGDTPANVKFAKPPHRRP